MFLKNIRSKKIYLPILFVTVVLLSVFLSVLVFAADGVTVEIDNCGSRLVAHVENASTPTYQWQVAETEDGTYSDIDGAADEFYDITVANEGKYIRVVSNGVQSEPVGPIGKLVVMDIGKGAITLDTTYSGKDSDGNAVSGTHEASNIYVIVHKDNTNFTTNNITFSGNHPNAPFDVTLSGVHMGATPTNHSQQPGVSGSGTPTTGQIAIPATNSAVKDVVIRIKGENIVRHINYYNAGDTSNPQKVDSSLKFTDINGDGEATGSLYVPVKLNADQIADFVKTNTNYNHWNAGIGGYDSNSLVQNLLIAGGKIQVVTTLGDNCTAIGAGGNGYCQMVISGGEVIAHCNGTGAAIGGGIGWNAAGGRSDVTISGGTVYAKNHAEIQSGNETVGGVAIGSGSSFYAAGSEGKVTITGGYVEAYGTFGNGIGGGNSSSSTGGKATITISGGTVIASSIGGGDSKRGIGGDATVKIEGDADVTLQKGIGGGLSQSGNGGAANITVNGGTMNCAGTIGGGQGGETGNGGAATITVTEGTLTAKSIGGGTGSVGGNGGEAKVTISGGKIETGSIGGGDTLNPTGQLGYASATISGGDITGQFIMAQGTQPCTFTMTGGTLHGVITADTSKYNYVKQDGAAVYMDDPNGDATLSGGSITDCSAANGGAIYMTAGTFTISGNGVIENCSATQNGGAIYIGSVEIDGELKQGRFVANGGEIKNNKAPNGGGVYLAGGTMEVNGGTITTNTAEQNGGGAYLGGGQMTVSGGNIISNTAQNGGGAYLAGGNLTVSGGAITNNTAQSNGGGFAVNNGNYSMTGGNVDNNTAIGGSGGALFVSSNNSTVSVEVLSGSISGNTAGGHGGAITVQGLENSTDTITVTVGVNEKHTVTQDSNGNTVVTCAHSSHNNRPNACPVVKDNKATLSGGAIYVKGTTNAVLNTYCIVESGSESATEKRSNFMKVEGGTIKISTLQYDEDTPDPDEPYGYIRVQETIYVTGGLVDIYGSMVNPLLEAPITVDILNPDTNVNHFNDHRTNDGLSDSEKIYKITYFENFFGTGQYTEYTVKHGEHYEMLANIYPHDGYDILGWFTEKEGEALKFEVGKRYYFNGIVGTYTPGDLTVYARWGAIGYTVEFRHNIPSGVQFTGNMGTQSFEFGVPKNLNLNTFVYPGQWFVVWVDENNNTYTDGQEVKNLTSVKGATVVLTAQWVMCVHEDSRVSTVYDSQDNLLMHTCKCGGYAVHMQLNVPKNAVYTGSPHYASLTTVKFEDVNNNAPTWNPELQYYKDSVETEPVNAGSYEVRFWTNEGTIAISFAIAKASQPAPDKPQYSEVKVDGKEGASISINSPLGNSAWGTTLVYKMVWNSGTTQEEIGWQTGTTFELTKTFTNYYIYAMYQGNENYLDSDVVRADAVLYYMSNVAVKLNCDQNIDCDMRKLDQATDDKEGVQFIVKAKDGYYLYNFSIVDDNVQATIVVDDPLSVYRLTDIPTNNGSELLTITVTISGACKKVTVSGAIAPNEVFGEVEGNDNVNITLDSAYTAYFEVTDFAHYTNLSLNFGRMLSIGTKLVLIDKQNDTYWYYPVVSAIDKVPLGDFKRMGTANTPFQPMDGLLQYQIIVDFSAVIDSNSMSTGDLVTTLTAQCVNANVPAFPDVRLKAVLNSKATFSVEVPTSAASLNKTLHYQYALVSDGVEASKWTDRSGALVLRYEGERSALPADLHVFVSVTDNAAGNLYNAEYYLNSDGVFVIPLPNAGVGKVEIELISDLFPNVENSYTFIAELYASCSKSGIAVKNGVQMASTNIVFTTTEIVTPSLRITGNDRAVTYEEEFTVNLEAKNLNGGKILVYVYSKGENGYFNTATEAVDVTPTIQGDDGVLVNTYTTSLGKVYTLTGGYCLLFEVLDSADAVVMTVPYYFVLSEDAVSTTPASN